MRAQASPAVLDGPSTSGRCVSSPPSVVYKRRHGRWCIAEASHMQLGLYNTQPLANFRPKPSDGVVQGARTTATPRLTPERVGGVCLWHVGIFVCQITAAEHKWQHRTEVAAMVL